jgi:hypothetical protein
MRTVRRRQAGNILVPVMLIGLTITLVLGALINSSVYLEQVAVEDRLAELRAYWATMGHFRYALSRQRHAGLCIKSLGCTVLLDTIKDTDKITALQSYLNEISGLRTFTYPEESGSYSIKIDLTAAVDDDPSRNTFSGHLMITNSYPTAGVSTLPVLAGVAQRFTPYQIRFCTSLNSAYGACGGVSSNNNNGKPTGLYSVKRLHRMQSVS